jgi:glycosyltransferase involved in cell wall biosynthesis
VGNDFEAVIACIPTVAAGVVGKRIAQTLAVPFGLIVQDLSGAGAKQSGLKGGALISKIALTVEGSVLKAADSMVVVSPAMRDVVLGFGVVSTKVSQITNYAARNIESVNRDLARASFGWAGDDFVVIQVKIYLVGHGNQEANLKRLCEGIENISVVEAVADDQYSALLAAADLLLVNERSTQMEMSLPSKLTSYLYSERPVIAAVPRGGATWKFLNGIAELVDAEKPTILASAIKEMSQNPKKRNDLASKGLEFARKNLGAEIGRSKYLDWVNTLIQSKRG